MSLRQRPKDQTLPRPARVSPVNVQEADYVKNRRDAIGVLPVVEIAAGRPACRCLARKPLIRVDHRPKSPNA
jgi:hypothetical protein